MEILFNMYVGVCVDDGCFWLPDLAESDWTLGLVKAAHLGCISSDQCTQVQPAIHTHTKGVLPDGKHTRPCIVIKPLK